MTNDLTKWGEEVVHVDDAYRSTLWLYSDGSDTTTIHIFDQEMKPSPFGGFIWIFVYVLTAQTSSGQVGPKFKIDSRKAGFHFSLKNMNRTYL